MYLNPTYHRREQGADNRKSRRHEGSDILGEGWHGFDYGIDVFAIELAVGTRRQRQQGTMNGVAAISEACRRYSGTRKTCR